MRHSFAYACMPRSVRVHRMPQEITQEAFLKKEETPKHTLLQQKDAHSPQSKGTEMKPGGPKIYHRTSTLLLLPQRKIPQQLWKGGYDGCGKRVRGIGRTSNDRPSARKLLLLCVCWERRHILRANTEMEQKLRRMSGRSFRGGNHSMGQEEDIQLQ